MKAKLIIAAVLSIFITNAQNSNSASAEKKQATIRIKKVENINGVEKITDTTYTTDDIESLKIEDGNGGTMDGKQIQIIELKGEELKGNLTDAEKEQKIKELTAEMQKFNQERTEKMAEELQKGEKGSTKVCRTTMITIHISVEEPNEAELKKINKEQGKIDGELKVKDLKFFPNPSNGQSLNLSFELADKGDATVDVLDINGKSVYTDKLNNFSGKYSNTIDISTSSKGIYFVKVAQGGHSHVKKLIIE